MNNMKIRTLLCDPKDIHRIMWNYNYHCTCSLMDHIVIGPRRRTPYVQDVRVYREADAISNCQLVIAKIKVKLKGQKRKMLIVRRFKTGKLIDPSVES